MRRVTGFTLVLLKVRRPGGDVETVTSPAQRSQPKTGRKEKSTN